MTPVSKDWRWKLALTIFLIVPVYGICKYIEHYQIVNSETEMAVSDFKSGVSENLTQVQISGFEADDVQVVDRYDSQLAVVTVADSESPTDTPAIVVLRQRKRDAETLLSDQVASGDVSGLVSSGRRTRTEYLVERGVSVPTSAPEWVLCVDVDRDYRSEIAKVTMAFFLLGLVALFLVHAKLEHRYVALRNQRSHARGLIALELAIARQETYHH